MPLGDDFRWDHSTEWDAQFNNYEKIIEYLNSNDNLHVEVGVTIYMYNFERLFKMKGFNYSRFALAHCLITSMLLKKKSRPKSFPYFLETFSRMLIEMIIIGVAIIHLGRFTKGWIEYLCHMSGIKNDIALHILFVYITHIHITVFQSCRDDFGFSEDES